MNLVVPTHTRTEKPTLGNKTVLLPLLFFFSHLLCEADQRGQFIDKYSMSQKITQPSIQCEAINFSVACRCSTLNRNGSVFLLFFFVIDIVVVVVVDVDGVSAQNQ